jgi:Glycosyl hydrolases family 35/Glycosyl hydrolases family 2, sugar binding domain
MMLHRKSVAIGLMSLAAIICGGRLALAADAEPRIHYDNQCITLDGKDMVLFSGAFHYFRCPKELWHDRFTKLKEAGFNTLETYVAWNYHEQNPPADPDDYSKLDLSEMHDWLAMATDQFGFNVILRPGPYICAEWDGGGYPQWLPTKKPADFKGREWLRGDDPTYLAWCKHWLTAVAKVAAPFQITHRPVGTSGIILWQIENEYDYSGQTPTVKKNQLDFLVHTSRDLGVDVPLTTCMTNDPLFQQDKYLQENVVETRNTYPKFDMRAEQRDITMLDRYQPNKFRMVTELQGGWFSQVGGQLSEAQGFDASHINHVTLFAWEHGFTVTNYYMGFGGTNFGDWAAAQITTTYDYDAPLRESGGTTERYLTVKALGNFIREHGANLSRTKSEQFTVQQKTDNDVVVSLRRANDGSRYLFVRTEARQGNRKGTIDLQTTGDNPTKISANYELGPFGSKVLYLRPNSGPPTWYPQPVEGPQRPAAADLPQPVQITQAKMQADTGPTDWTSIQPGQSEEQGGIFNRGFVFYRTTVPKSDKATVLTVNPRNRDWAGFQVNGKWVNSGDRGASYALDPSASGGTLIGLYENSGRANIGADLGKPCGLLNLRIGQPPVTSAELADWRMIRVSGGNHAQELAPETDDSTWMRADTSQIAGQLQANQSAVFRCWVTLSDDDLKTGKTLWLGRVDDQGVVYVNGNNVGQCNDWAQAQQFDVGKYLHAGKNLIAVLVINQDGGGGLSGGTRLEVTSPSLAGQWQISDQTAGVDGKWATSEFDDTSWPTVKLDGTILNSAATVPLLNWYRLHFSLPQPKEHQWVPWKVRLDIVGNGFLYLNGHPLGRWWQQGPQREFFLPECWMNFGDGKTNVLTISLRPTEGVGVRSAEVGPYENLAEVR